MQFHSPDIPSDGFIPVQYTCDGLNVNPALSWSPPPKGTRSLVLLVDDPDAQSVVGHTVCHLAVINVPPGLTHIQRNQDWSQLSALPLYNDMHRLGWSGPCPPRGHGVHHYHFHLYALNVPFLPIDASMLLTSAFFEQYFMRFIVAKVTFVAMYQRI